LGRVGDGNNKPDQTPFPLGRVGDGKTLIL